MTRSGSETGIWNRKPSSSVNFTSSITREKNKAEGLLTVAPRWWKLSNSWLWYRISKYSFCKTFYEEFIQIYCRNKPNVVKIKCVWNTSHNWRRLEVIKSSKPWITSCYLSGWNWQLSWVIMKLYLLRWPWQGGGGGGRYNSTQLVNR